MDKLETVFIVDDDSEFVADITSELENDFRIVSCGDVDGLIDKFNKFNPKILILDDVLSEKNSYSALMEVIRERAENDEFYVIMIAENFGARFRDWVLEMGVSEYLRKPVGIRKLAGLVREYAER
ncbi:MAG: response regulator [Nanoarchaeota archaeon]